MKKIAFCFLIYDIINHEVLWKKFFDNIDKNKYNIYIHYKYNKPLKYFEEYKLNNCIETKYGDITIIYAHNLLFKKAFEDGCFKMINLSQACIPLKSFDHIYNFLTNDNYCHFNIADKSQIFPRCNNLLNYYNKNNIQKSANWFILNRKICELVINYNNIDNEYKNITSPEEHYYITLIYHNNLQNEIISTSMAANDATTFTNWPDLNYKYHDKNWAGLKNYNYINSEELSYLLNSKCLFGRKFNIGCNI